MPAPRSSSSSQWAAIPADALWERLEVDPAHGLSTQQAEHRRQTYGANTLETAQRLPWWRVLWRQFHDPLVVVLLVAMGISWGTGERLDAAVIAAIVVLNAVLGFIQEWRAERAIEALQAMLSPHSRVVRDGAPREVPSEDLVPGDVILLERGERVGADVRLTHAHELQLDESALTGESVPARKSRAAVDAETPLAEQTSMAWMGTLVVAGSARGVVVATGAETAFGRVSSLTGSIERLASPLQRKLATVGRQLGAVALIICAAMVGLGVLTGGAWVEMMMAAISLAVAAVPEGLPTVVTITLALGIRQMVQRNVLLRRLSAAEALGATTVICTDKTGTLTQNEMTAQLLWQPGGLWHITGVGYAPEGTFVRDDVHTTPEQDPDLRAALEAARQCNNAALRQDEHGWRALGMPTEAALLVAAGKGGLELHTDPPAREHAFDSTRKRMSVVTHDGDAHIAYVKGAPEVIAARCTQMSIAGELRPLDSATREAFEAARADFAARGLRTLAVAMRRLSADTFIGDADAVEQELVLLGLWGIADPPRRDVAAALESAQHAGVDVIMITGDAPETALAIAEQVGLGAREALTGADLDAMPDDQISAALTPRRLALDRRRRPPRDDHPRGAQGDLVATPPRSDTSAYFAPYRVLLVNPARPHSALRPREVAGTLYALSHCIH